MTHIYPPEGLGAKEPSPIPREAKDQSVIPGPLHLAEPLRGFGTLVSCTMGNREIRFGWDLTQTS